MPWSLRRSISKGEMVSWYAEEQNHPAGFPQVFHKRFLYKY
jgi:hypothetical protein